MHSSFSGFHTQAFPLAQRVVWIGLPAHVEIRQDFGYIFQ